ncbi:hypothetical protein TNCV_1680861 [Trichonephila clavipes]|nr:hypothetical protein TNCV_1680861 [Trichonephila clavipes]
MYGRKYQWIIVGMYRERWWEVRDHNSSCSPWELSLAMEGHISTDVLPLSSSENITVSGLGKPMRSQVINKLVLNLKLNSVIQQPTRANVYCAHLSKWDVGP